MYDRKSRSDDTLDSFLMERRRRQIRQALLVAALVIPGLLGAYLLLRSPEPPPQVVEVVKAEPPKPAPKPVVSQPPPPPEPEPQAIVLPPLDQSDTFIRDLATNLSKRPEIGAWLLTDNLVRRFVAAVDAVATGQSPRGQLKMMWPRGRFKTIGEIFQEPVIVDPRSYDRYDLIAQAFVSLDVEGSITLYQRILPMVDAAYADLGYPDHDFQHTILMAIEELLSTPVMVGDATLSPRVISYAYEDTDLEGLSAAQKQFLRMGPSNMSKVQKKLRVFAAAFGVSNANLPKSRIYNATPVAQR
jgi:hypothetical protein